MEHMKNVKSVTVAALLVALAVTLKFFENRDYADIGVQLRLSRQRECRFSVRTLCGRNGRRTLGSARLCGASHGAFFPGFTLNAIINGVVYGLVLYRKPVSMQRVVIARLT